MEGETTRGRNDLGRNDSGRTGKWAKRPVTVFNQLIMATVVLTRRSVVDRKFGNSGVLRLLETYFAHYPYPNHLLTYLNTKVMHGCIKPVFITLRYLTHPVIEFPFQKELFSETIPHTMA